MTAWENSKGNTSSTLGTGTNRGSGLRYRSITSVHMSSSSHIGIPPEDLPENYGLVEDPIELNPQSFRSFAPFLVENFYKQNSSSMLNV